MVKIVIASVLLLLVIGLARAIARGRRGQSVRRGGDSGGGSHGDSSDGRSDWDSDGGSDCGGGGDGGGGGD